LQKVQFYLVLIGRQLIDKNQNHFGINKHQRSLMMKQPLLSLGILLIATSFNINASLTSYASASNVGLVYSSVSEITWTQDANLFKTMYDEDNSLVSQISNRTTGPQKTSETYDFNPETGQMSWFGAQAFVDYLNSIAYAGSSEWRLPKGGSDIQHGYNQTNTEMGQLFYTELSGVAGSSIPDTSAFDNEQEQGYWFDNDRWGQKLSPQFAYWFGAYNGFLTSTTKGSWGYVWPVSPGQIAAVPVPGAVWLFCTILVGWLGLNKR
jgi:hypothetical protein